MSDCIYQGGRKAGFHCNGIWKSKNSESLLCYFFHCIRFNQTKSPRDQVAMDEIEDRLRRKVRISSIFYFFYFLNGVLFYVY